jgi:hypothetical protein
VSALPWWLRYGLVAVGLLLLDRLLLWAEDRDWIRYRKRPPGASSVGAALLQMQALFEHDKQHVVDEQRAIREDGDEEGGPRPPPRSDVPPA